MFLKWLIYLLEYIPLFSSLRDWIFNVIFKFDAIALAKSGKTPLKSPSLTIQQGTRWIQFTIKSNPWKSNLFFVLSMRFSIAVDFVFPTVCMQMSSYVCLNFYHQAEWFFNYLKNNMLTSSSKDLSYLSFFDTKYLSIQSNF